MNDMVQAPQQDWVFYEALTRANEVQRLRSLRPQERFAIYEDLYRLISDGRRLGDWARLDAWRWKQKTALRQRLVDAYRRLDQLRSERASSHDAG